MNTEPTYNQQLLAKLRQRGAQLAAEETPSFARGYERAVQELQSTLKKELYMENNMIKTGIIAELKEALTRRDAEIKKLTKKATGLKSENKQVDELALRYRTAKGVMKAHGLMDKFSEAMNAQQEMADRSRQQLIAAGILTPAE